MRGKEAVFCCLFVVVLFGSMALSAVLCTFHYECLISSPSVSMKNKLLEEHEKMPEQRLDSETQSAGIPYVLI